MCFSQPTLCGGIDSDQNYVFQSTVSFDLRTVLSSPASLSRARMVKKGMAHLLFWLLSLKQQLNLRGEY